VIKVGPIYIGQPWLLVCLCVSVGRLLLVSLVCQCRSTVVGVSMCHLWSAVVGVSVCQCCLAIVVGVSVSVLVAAVGVSVCQCWSVVVGLFVCQC